MSKKTKRMKTIIDLLNKKGEISVKELSQHLLASHATVRRYLGDLEEEGIIRRTHGGAILQDYYSINDSNKYLIGKEIEKHVKEKSSIGLKAASLVQPGETVAFDIGSTTHFISKYIGREIEIHALCVTFECAMELYHKKNVNLILTGGHLHRDSDVINSDEGIDIIKKIRTDKVFLSAGGIDEKLGLTCYHDFHVVIKRALMESSKKIILVADSSKFGTVTPSFYADLTEIDALITDSNIPEKYRSVLATLGVELIIADH
jgi:DeoR family deoxyribose operon repressor